MFFIQNLSKHCFKKKSKPLVANPLAVADQALKKAYFLHVVFERHNALMKKNATINFYVKA